MKAKSVLYPSAEAMRAYCWVLSQETARAFPLIAKWSPTPTVKIEVALSMGVFRAIADGLRAPNEFEARAIAEMMKHFTPAPELILEPEDYDRFFPPSPL